MAATAERSALTWVFRRPLARRGRLAALFLASLGGALLGGASLTSAYPLLVILFDEQWGERLAALAERAPALLLPLARAVVALAVGGDPLTALTWVLSLLVGAMLLAALLQLAQDWIAAPLVHDAVRGVATEAHEALLQGAGADTPQGALLALFTADLDALRVTLQKVFSKVVHEPFKLLFSLGLLVAIDGRLALVMGLLFPLAAGAILFLSRRLRDRARRTLAQTGSLVALVEEGLRGRRVVRAHGLEARERSRFAQVQLELTGNQIALDRHEALSSPLLELMVALAAAAVILVGAQRVVARELSAEALLTFFAVLASMLDPMRKLADTQVRTRRGAAAAARLKALVDSVPATPPIHGTRPFPRLARGLELCNVAARAANGAPLLAGVDLVARPGEVVLVAGRSGAGKSTLLDLLAGLRRYDGGSIELEGVPLPELDAAGFRARIGMVTQETFLFRGSIEENVTLGTPPRSVALHEALAAAGLAELVASLPHGAATPIESRAFSAGERQRLAIARALYRDPALLLLDEATSALDRPVEEKILARVFAARAGRITFVVTHRLASELPYDQVVVLDHGVVAARGAPHELLEGSALYRELVHGAADGD
ncbi:MAG: ABC transporter ATP-binding protein [Planctomycetes bacterium]|nr:ABC transporter ATP-binding protein [Planctomycetota bacterium]